LNINHVCVWVLSDLQLVLIHGALVRTRSSLKKIVQLVKIKLDHVALERYAEVGVPLHFVFDVEHLDETPWYNTYLAVCSVNGVGLT
jgi:hypothetical protein